MLRRQLGSVLFMVALFHCGTCQEANEQQALRGSSRRQLNDNSVRFDNPKVQGINLDYCNHYDVSTDSQGKQVWRSRDCGQAAADAFCRAQGFGCADQRGLGYGYDMIYYSHDATYVQGDQRVYERDENPSHGAHTYFRFVTCVS